jgi:voltage-gated potassium channel
MVAYRSFYEDLSSMLNERFEMTSDHQRYHNVTTSNLFARQYNEGMGSRNNIILRVAWSACLWDSRRIAIARTIAEALSHHFDSAHNVGASPELKHKTAGYSNDC